MTLINTARQGIPAATTDAPGPRCWGLSIRELHDRRWTLKGAQVIRRGRGRVDAKGPEVYLLVEPDDLVWFDLAPMVKRLAWLKPRILRLRVVDADAEQLSERVAHDAEGRLHEIRRQYRPRVRGTLRPLLTPDHRLAEQWAQAAGSRQEALRSLRAAVGRDGELVAATTGRVFSAGERDQRDAYLGLLVSEWKSPNAALDGVYEYQPGVWMHETTRADPGARFVAPVWIGAGAHVGAGRTLIGPGLMEDDAASSATPANVAWEDLRMPQWRLGPRLPGRPGWGVAKRAFDIAFSAFVLIVTAPLYPFIIALIALEDGWPPFFAHWRQTVGGREFPCYKFRTMCRDAEGMKAQLAAKNQADGPQFFIEDDPRLLRVGKFLRRFQLDEIPQFWNVLLGHMSVVGPRPSPDKENQYCPVWREARLSVRPGVTGLWQVARTRAPETDFQEWIRYDLEYVRRQSWRLDIWIIWRTIAKVLGG